MPVVYMQYTTHTTGMLILDTGCPGCSERGWQVFGISAWWILLLVIFVVGILAILRYLMHPEVIHLDTLMLFFLSLLILFQNYLYVYRIL